MIAHEEMPPDPVLDACRLAVLEACECAHPILCFSTIDVLEHALDVMLKEMADLKRLDADIPTGLTDMILVFKDPRAVNIVATRMEPGFEFWALHLPDAWPILYQRIGELRAKARRYDPSFVSKYR